MRVQPLMDEKHLSDLKGRDDSDPRIEAGFQQLDGEDVRCSPEHFWRGISSDARNRIPLALGCLLIEAPNALVLVDTGVGNKYNEKL